MNKTLRFVIPIASVALIGLIVFSILAVPKLSGDTVLVYNPYENVDWENDTLARANLHSHTHHSDGQSPPHDVVDFYHQAGYHALAITDHDLVTYPWTFSAINPLWEDRDPGELGMLAIPGNEYSYNHHLTGLYTLYEASLNESLDDTLDVLTSEADAIAFFAHPGRYWKVFDDYAPTDEYAPEWYINYFTDYPDDVLIGMEVFSRNDRHPYDRVLWDMILTELMPHRVVMGLANDDYHGSSPDFGLGWSFTHHIVSDLMSAEQFRQSLLDGAFFASNTRIALEDTPGIEQIIVNTRWRYIEIVASDYKVINWISGVDENKTSQIVHTGSRFYYSDFDGNYVRAEIIKGDTQGTQNITLTQPFGFSKDD